MEDNSIPWIEKYRPTNIDDIMMDPHLKKKIKIYLDDSKDKHLIIVGDPGTGKTSTVRCLALEKLGENIKEGYLELNAGDDRGVKSISSIIPTFCKKIITFEEQKIILFDEADNLTNKSQYDINLMIKLYGKKTKFIFTCNDSTKIITDIQSVCQIVYYKKLNNDLILSYLIKICKEEEISYTKEGINIICYIASGDMRKAINDLQKTVYSYGEINKKNVLKSCKVPDPDDIKYIINICYDYNLVEVNNKMNELFDSGYNYNDIVSGFSNVIQYYEMEEEERLRILCVINQTKIIISTGTKSKLQLIAMICRIMNELKTNNK